MTTPEDATLFARFGGLLADNPLRRAVRTNSDLETLLKGPMDITALEHERAEKLDRKRSLQDRLDDTVDETESELAEARDTADSFDLDRLRSERSRLREELEGIDERIDVLQSVLTVNRELLETDLQGPLDTESLLEGDRHGVLGLRPVGGRRRVRGDRRRTRGRRRGGEGPPPGVRAQLADVEDDISDGQAARRRVSRLEQRLESVRSKRETRAASLAEKRERLDDVEAEFDEMAARLDSLRAERADDHADLSERIEDARVDLESERREIERLESELASLRDQREERAATKEQLETLMTEIRDLTERIENLETDLRTGFNDAMDELIETLDFRDVERMWLDGDFELVVAREVDGSVQEDSVKHLAESERGMIGLVLGLAGYLAYDVADVVPMLVIDSLGAFDAERTRRLVEYFGEHTDYLVAAVHPEQVEGASDALDRVRVSPNPS